MSSEIEMSSKSKTTKEKLEEISFDMEESVYLRQLSFLILKKDRENDRMIVRQGPLTTLYYYFLILICIEEIVKNFFYIITPMNDIRRFYVGDMVSSRRDDQRLINLLLFLVYVGVWYLLIFFINGEHKRTFVHLFPFLLKMKVEDYVDKFHVKKEYSLGLLKELKMRTRANLMSRVVYLGTLYSFYATGIWLAFRNGIDKRIIFFSILPTTFSGILGISTFYFFLSDIISTYTIYCGYLTARLDRLSDELRKVPRRKSKKWFESHLYNFNQILRDFDVAHLHFERAIMMWMPAFYCTFAIFPYCLLISEKMYTHGLLPHFVLNTFFLLFPLFLSNEKFTNGLKRYSASVYFYLRFQNQLQNKNKLAHVFVINNPDHPVLFTFFHLFEYTSHFSLTIFLESITICFLFYTFMNI